MAAERVTQQQAVEARQGLHALIRQAKADFPFDRHNDLPAVQEEQRAFRRMFLEEAHAERFSTVLTSWRARGTQEEFNLLPQDTRTVLTWVEDTETILGQEAPTTTVHAIIGRDIENAFNSDLSRIQSLSNVLATQPDSEAKVRLQRAFLRRVESLMRDRAETIPAQHLADIISWYVHNPLAEETAIAMLHGYFEAPEKKKDEERLNAYASSYNKLAEATSLLAHDRDALTRATEIGNFIDDRVLPVNGSYAQQVLSLLTNYDMYTLTGNPAVIKEEGLLSTRSEMLGEGVLPYSFSFKRDKKTTAITIDLAATSPALTRFRLIQHADIIFENLVRLVGLDDEKIRAAHNDVVQNSALDLRTRMMKQFGGSVRRHAFPLNELLLAIVRDKLASKAIESPSLNLAEVAQRSANPIFKAMYMDLTDRAIQLYYRDIFPEVNLSEWKRQTREHVGSPLREATIRIPGSNQTIFILLPEGVNFSQELLQELIQHDNEQTEQENAQATDQGYDLDALDKITSKLPVFRGQFGDFTASDGTPVYYLVRTMTNADRQIHPAVTLESLGLPAINLEQGQNIQATNSQLADSIIANRIRFLSNRGYQIPLQGTPFEAFGYTALTLRADVNYPLGARATFTINGEDISVHLDQNLQLAFNGQTPPSLDFQAILRYNILWYLENILCAPVRQSGEGVSSDPNKAIVQNSLPGRAAHFTTLPIDTRSGRQMQPSWIAINRALDETGINLEIMNEQRRRIGLPPRTYTQAVETDTDTEPVRIPLATPPLFQ